MLVVMRFLDKCVLKVNEIKYIGIENIIFYCYFIIFI